MARRRLSLRLIAIKRLGAGQFDLINIKDRDGAEHYGSKTYRLPCRPGVPVEQYWSLTAYDRDTHALIKNVDRASRASNNPDVKQNADRSVDVFVGAKAPAGQESNWIPTDPARKFELMFRLYGPKKEFFDKVWKLPDVEESPGIANQALSIGKVHHDQCSFSDCINILMTGTTLAIASALVGSTG